MRLRPIRVRGADDSDGFPPVADIGDQLQFRRIRRGLLCIAFFLATGCATIPDQLGKGDILAVDEQQRAMVATADVAGLERISHSNLRINAPGGRVLTREQFLSNMRSGEIAAESFERTAEDVSVTGNVAVVMGREVFTPMASSELGRNYGPRPLQRRYTNVYVWQQGRWFWLARQASIIVKVPR